MCQRAKRGWRSEPAPKRDVLLPWPGTCLHAVLPPSPQQTLIKLTDTGPFTTIQPSMATNSLGVASGGGGGVCVSKSQGSRRTIPCQHMPQSFHHASWGALRLEEREDPGWGGDPAKLISAISLLRTTLPGSHLAPPRQNQPLCLASGSWLGSERVLCPIPSPPRPGLPGGTQAGWQGVLRATGCQKLRRAWKATRALPAEEASPRLIAPVTIKAGCTWELPAGSRCCLPSAPGWD